MTIPQLRKGPDPHLQSRASSPQPSGRPPLGTQGPAVTVWPWLAAGWPEPALPRCSRCPGWVPGPHSGQHRTQGSPEPGTQG